MPRTPRAVLTRPSCITPPRVRSRSSQWSRMALSNIRLYSNARRMISALITGEPSSVNATAPPSTSPPISASSSPLRPLVMHPTGQTLAYPARCAWWMTNSAWAWLSSAGSVLGMHATDVTPPATAAAVPVAIVSSSSRPGSRRWTCMSIRPGETIIPVQSRVRSAAAPGCGPVPRMVPSFSHRSATRSRFWDGSMTRPLRSRRVGMGGTSAGRRVRVSVRKTAGAGKHTLGAGMWHAGCLVHRPTGDAVPAAGRVGTPPTGGGHGRSRRPPERHAMSTATPPPASPNPPGTPAVPVYQVPPPEAAQKRRIDYLIVYGHSNLFYWWPVWLVSFILAGVTYFEGQQMAVVPAGTVVEHDRAVEGVAGRHDVLVAPEGRAFGLAREEGQAATP